MVKRKEEKGKGIKKLDRLMEFRVVRERMGVKSGIIERQEKMVF